MKTKYRRVRAGCQVSQGWPGRGKIFSLNLLLAGEYNYRLRCSLLWDYADGMFWQGWSRGKSQAAGEYE